MAAQAGLCLAWSETPEDTFSRVVAHMNVKKEEESLEINDIDCLWLDITPCKGKSF